MTVLDSLETITMMNVSPEIRAKAIMRKKESGLAVNLHADYGLIHVDGKPIRVIVHNGQLYYSLRDIQQGAGVTKGYHKKMSLKIKAHAVKGPGVRNPANYLPADFLSEFSTRFRYEHSKAFVRQVIASVKMPSDALIDLLISFQNLSLKGRQAAFAAWKKVVAEVAR